MSACSVPRGIFSLRECGNHAAETCSACQGALCLEHANFGREQILCPKCLVASGTKKPDENDNDDDVSDWESPGWSNRWSSNYNTSHAAIPLAVYGSQHFDNFDRNAFATRSDGVPDDDGESGPAGFSDS